MIFGTNKKLPSSMVAIVDSFVPEEIFQFFHEEEKWKARSVVVVLLINFMMGISGYLIYLVTDLTPENLHHASNVAFCIDVIGYSAALLAFRYSMPYSVVALIYAITAYVSIGYFLTEALAPQFVAVKHLLMTIPIFVYVIAGFMHALLWTAIVFFTPIVYLLFFSSAEQVIPLNALDVSISSFLYLSFLVAFYIVDSYQKQITGRLNVERMEFEYAAAHDELTGLVNRATFDKRIISCMEASKFNNSKVVLAVIDLDGFKAINDEVGHHAGDEVLRVIAKRLLENVRTTDTVARLGGDEFAIIFHQQDDLARARICLQRVSTAIALPIHYESQELRVTGSVGAVVYPDHSDDAEDLKRKADSAMYRAKNVKNHVLYYSVGV